jgi:NADH dehydrogenase (ubiquinone) Fe-S protein 1
MDAVGSGIRVDSKGCEVMRILPRTNEDVNEEWLSDKGRFACDALTRRRILRPQIREGGALKAITWNAALTELADRMLRTPAEDIQVLVGPFTDVETVKAAHDLFTQLGVTALDFDGPRRGMDVARLPRSLIRIPPIAEIEGAGRIVLVGTNPRHEAPLVNARIRKAYLHNDAHIQYIGPGGLNLTYAYEHLGVDNRAILKIDTSGRDILILVGQHLIMDRPDYADTLHALGVVLGKNASVRIGVLPRWASRTGALHLGWGSLPNPSAKLTIALAADDLQNVPKDSFLVYLGHHGDLAAPRANLLLPTPAYTEKDALWVNCEGRWQRGRAAVAPPGDGRSDWSVMRALSEYLEAASVRVSEGGCMRRSIQRLPYDSLDELRHTMDFTLDAVPEWQSESNLAERLLAFRASNATPSPYTLPITDYYLTDSISRNSETMAKCSLAFTQRAYRHTFEIDRAVHQVE